MRVVIGSIVVFLVVVALAGLGYIYSGAYNVSAKVPENPVVAWVLETTRDRSIQAHARGLTPPEDLSSPQVVKAGAEHYREDCAVCHGSPGDYPGEIGKGLNPEPPRLWADDQPVDPREIFWVIMHGIKMTGMPAWDHELAAEQAWTVVAFVEALPNMSAEQYRRLTGEAPAQHVTRP